MSQARVREQVLGKAPSEISQRRLEAQRISTTRFTRADEAVAYFGAVQAQDYFGALWAVGLRLFETRAEVVERTLTERKIVRMWPMRGTLHFVAASDARWITELLAPRAAAGAVGRLRALGIDGPVLSRARRVLVKNLEGGRQLTRPAAYRLLERAKVATDGQRGLHLLWRLAHDCLLCFGPREGKQQTFVLFDEWLPKAKSLPREEALAEIAHRYFTAHGPATLADFAWWSGLRLADARLAVVLAEKRIVEATIEGRSFWMAPHSSPPIVSCAGAYVLPAFDEFLVGYTDRTAVIDASHMICVNVGTGILNPTIVVDGWVVGTWKRRIEQREVVFSLAPFAALSKPKAHAVWLALGRYARFFGLEVRNS